MDYGSVERQKKAARTVLCSCREASDATCSRVFGSPRENLREICSLGEIYAKKNIAQREPTLSSPSRGLLTLFLFPKLAVMCSDIRWMNSLLRRISDSVPEWSLHAESRASQIVHITRS